MKPRDLIRKRINEGLVAGGIAMAIFAGFWLFVRYVMVPIAHWIEGTKEPITPGHGHSHRGHGNNHDHDHDGTSDDHHGHDDFGDGDHGLFSSRKYSGNRIVENDLPNLPSAGSHLRNIPRERIVAAIEAVQSIQNKNDRNAVTSVINQFPDVFPQNVLLSLANNRK